MNPPEAQRCDCGYDFLTSPPPEQAGSPPRYRGVRGWLLWLCFGLTVISPIWTLVNLSRTWEELSPYFARFPRLEVMTIIDNSLSLGLMVFSIYAGMQLWRVRPHAVPTAKKYFVCLLVYQGIASVLPFMAGLPPEANQEMFKQVIGDGIRAVIGVAIWYSYLNKSQRVQATYAL
jgi:hypothetical protein